MSIQKDRYYKKYAIRDPKYQTNYRNWQWGESEF